MSRRSKSVAMCVSVLLGVAGVGAAQPNDPACPLPVSCSGDTCYITGSVPTGMWTFTNKDVVIYDATLYECGGERTFTLLVTNGRLIVGLSQLSFGINGRGTDGTDGANGVPGTNPGAGGSPGQAFNVVLLTSPGSATRPRDITIAKPVDVSGGNGGDGGDGYHDYWNQQTCTYTPAQNGAAATAGSAGGSIVIIGCSDIIIEDTVSVAGGTGGTGGDGGAASAGAGGTPQPGQLGGVGGAISISHSDDSAATQCVLGGYVYDTRCYFAYVTAEGGRGGDGGNGADGNGPTVGANAAAGGPAGTVSFGVTALTINGPNIIAKGVYCVQAAIVGTKGGDGGFGGRGGRGSNGLIQIPHTGGGPPEYCYNQCHLPMTGAQAGFGGSGGSGGTLSLSSSTIADIGDRGIVFSDGGLGGLAGIAGDGAAQACGMPACPGDDNLGVWCPQVTSGGASRASAAGGKAGEITIVAGTELHCGFTGYVSARGGNGGQGLFGARSGAGCCCDCTPTGWNCLIGQVVYATACVGGNGGGGGGGNNIRLSFGTRTGYPNFYFCGGQGGEGGKGGPGHPPGLGGWSGSTGGGGKLFYNNVAQNILCGLVIPHRAPTGDDTQIICNEAD